MWTIILHRLLLQPSLPAVPIVTGLKEVCCTCTVGSGLPSGGRPDNERQIYYMRERRTVQDRTGKALLLTKLILDSLVFLGSLTWMFFVHKTARNEFVANIAAMTTGQDNISGTCVLKKCWCFTVPSVCECNWIWEQQKDLVVCFLTNKRGEFWHLIGLL